jgi:tetratricopeptide (TPR) repeat protein
MAKSASITAGQASGSTSATSKVFRWTPARLAVVIICLLLIGGVGCFVAYPQLAGAYHWRNAQQALEQYDFPRAKTHLRRCLEIWPGSGESAFLLARTCRRAGEFSTARTHLQEAERLGWTPALVDLERLLMAAQAGMVQPVEQELGRFLETRPDERAIIFEALVKGCLQGNFLDDAYGWCTRWVEDLPEDCQAHLLRGRVLESGLRYDLAAKEYQRALECTQKSASLLLLKAHLGLGEMLLRKGQYAAALPHFQAYLQGQPHDTAALLGLARCQRCLSPPEVALATLDQLLAEHEADAGALLLRGQLELERGHAAEALPWLQRAEHLPPQDVDTYQALATALRLLNRKEEAQAYETKRQLTERDLRRMEELTKEIIQRPRDAALRYEAGTILLRLGQEQQGARWLATALLVDPHHQPTRKALALCLPKLGDPHLVEHYRRILHDE